MDRYIIFNSWDKVYKSPFGAIKTDESIRFTIHLPKTIFQKYVYLRVSNIDNPEIFTRYQMNLDRVNLIINHYTVRVSLDTTGLYGYCFEISNTLYTEDNSLATENTRTQLLKKGVNNAATLIDGGLWQLTVFDKNMKRPNNFGTGIIYQIFPDRFSKKEESKENIPKDRWHREDWGSIPKWHPDEKGLVKNNDFYGGNLQGIIEKLDYIKSLGVTCIYLNPIFESHTNHRYDTADYLKIDPSLGNESDFKELCEMARINGISVILDGVFNHTGSDSVYFNKNKRYGDGGAYNDKNSPYFSWYNFTHYPDEYESWWGFKTLPSVNEDDESFLEFICGDNGVLKKWLDLGASGYRLDVVDELTDNLLDKMYQKVKSQNENFIIIGEVWEDASNKFSYSQRRRYLLGAQMDGVMNYPFRNSVLSYIRYGDAAKFYNTIMVILENYPKPVINSMMNILSTHDTPRAITMLSGKTMIDENDRDWQEKNHYLSSEDYESGKTRLILASIIQHGLPGIPSLYYGDEAGLSGYRDPFNRICYPWDHKDIDLIDVFKRLGQFRMNNPELTTADSIPLYFEESICVFLRVLLEKNFLFVINRSDKPENIPYTIPENAQIIFQYGTINDNEVGALSGIVFLWHEKINLLINNN